MPEVPRPVEADPEEVARLREVRVREVRAGLKHPCLPDPSAGRRSAVAVDAAPPGRPLGSSALGDRERLGLLLQGVALVAHLDHAGLRLPAGWGIARVVGDRLRVGPVERGEDPRLPQERALDLLHRLFLPGAEGDAGDGRWLPARRSRRRIAGPGAARRAARALQRDWDEGLLPLPGDHLVGRLLEEAPFLWEEGHAAARAALAGRHGASAAADGGAEESASVAERTNAGERTGEAPRRVAPAPSSTAAAASAPLPLGRAAGEGLWIAGPGPFRWGLLRRAAGDRRELDRLLTSGEARRWLLGGPGVTPRRPGDAAAPGADAPSAPAPRAKAGSWRLEVAAWSRRPPGDRDGCRRHAAAWLALGRARRALEVLRGGPVPAAAASAPVDAVAGAGACSDSGLEPALEPEVDAESAPATEDVRDLALAAACQLHLGRLRVARRSVSRARERAQVAGIELPPSLRLDLAEVKVRALANAGDAEAAWAEAVETLEALRRAAPRHRARAHLLAALAAWDGGDREALRRHLEEAAPLAGEREGPASDDLRAPDTRGAQAASAQAAPAQAATTGSAARRAPDPVHAAILRQTRALAALADGDAAAAAAELARALAEHRRRLPRHLAAGLWNDLALARARDGDLAGAEKGFARSLALHRGCDGTRRTTVGLANLAEVRLRRGRLRGVEAILERAGAANRAAGNQRLAVHDLLLWGRCELARGRARVALEVLRQTVEAAERRGLVEDAAEARLLAARALGWLGRSDEAAAELERVPPDILDRVEPEERPAVLAHAGRRDDALAAAGRAASGAGRTALALLWEAVLTGRPLPPGGWRELAELGSYRAGRAVFDLELLRPGAVPPEHRRAAIAALRSAGASRLAERLEARDEGPWRALAHHLARRPESPSAPLAPVSARGEDAAPPAPARGAVTWSTLLADAGHPEARVWWESDEDARVLVDRAGGPHELAEPCEGGRLVLRAAHGGPALEALFQLLRREAGGVLRAVLAAEVASSPSRRRSARSRDAASDPPRVLEGGIVGASPALRRAVARAEALAPGEVPILVLGESGTGKELLAKRIHAASRRRDGPRVAVNCAALSETLVLSDLFGHVRGAFTGAERDRAGVFETADGGTVFLDEIGDLPPPAQGMLLRVLQEGEVRRVGESVPRRVDVRLVAATHKDLAAAVEEGTFRRDLYFRLKGATVVLPPLRERGRDVLLLAAHLLEGAHRRAGGEGPAPVLGEAARGRLLAHTWPGNVRELQNVLAVAAALALAEAAAEPDGPARAGMSRSAGRGGKAPGGAADGGDRSGIVLEPRHLEVPAAPGDGDRGSVRAGVGYHQQVEAFRRRLVEEALGESGGNQAAAARHLGITRQALSYLVRTLEIRVPRRRSGGRGSGAGSGVG